MIRLLNKAVDKDSPIDPFVHYIAILKNRLTNLHFWLQLNTMFRWEYRGTILLICKKKKMKKISGKKNTSYREERRKYLQDPPTFTTWGEMLEVIYLVTFAALETIKLEEVRSK